MKKGLNLKPKDFVIEKTFLQKNLISKKIYMSQDGIVSKKEVSALTDYTSKTRDKEKRFVEDEFLIDFILSKNLKPQTVYEVAMKKGKAYFKIKTLKPPFSQLQVESPKGIFSAKIKHNNINDLKLNKLHFQKSNLSLLPCSLDTQAEIFKNKDVSSFIGDHVAQAVHK